MSSDEKTGETRKRTRRIRSETFKLPDAEDDGESGCHIGIMDFGLGAPYRLKPNYQSQTRDQTR